ncbi:hypothetical protein, partial [Escherichia coli]|uniref:hypothetical protein n=1 Tax=Escherichia coli TaxID=562 RepID=UPI0015855FDA
SVLRPFPSLYTHEENKDFDALLADTTVLPNLKELLQSAAKKDHRLWNLLEWILSSKLLSVTTEKKTEYEKIQELTGFSNSAVPPPDFLFQIVYSEQMNAKFEETKGEKDLIYAFHGSRLENFHSILHSGLHCHLNKT